MVWPDSCQNHYNTDSVKNSSWKDQIQYISTSAPHKTKYGTFSSILKKKKQTRCVGTTQMSPLWILRRLTRPKIIGPERNVNLICNLSLYTHIPNIKSISQSIATKSGHQFYFGITDMGNTIFPGHLVAGT